MTKRESLRLAAASMGMSAVGPSPGSTGPGRGKFGGWTARTLEASDSSRPEKAGDRHWLVTPNGSAYLIHSIDHIGSVSDQPRLQPFALEWETRIARHIGSTNAAAEIRKRSSRP